MAETKLKFGFHPLYRQVKELMIRRLLSGDWKPGELLPSEGRLATEFNVSQGTVRKALEEMAAEHLVVRHQGRGTFVTARSTGSPWNWFSLTTVDHKAIANRTTLSLNWNTGKATEAESADLSVAVGQPVLRIHRVRAVGSDPIFTETITMEEGRFPGLPDCLAKEPQANTYILLEREFGVLVVRCDEYLSAVMATEDDARELEVATGSPLIQILRIGYGLDDVALDRRIIRINTERCLYHNALS